MKYKLNKFIFFLSIAVLMVQLQQTKEAMGMKKNKFQKNQDDEIIQKIIDLKENFLKKKKEIENDIGSLKDKITQYTDEKNALNRLRTKSKEDSKKLEKLQLLLETEKKKKKLLIENSQELFINHKNNIHQLKTKLNETQEKKLQLMELKILSDEIERHQPRNDKNFNLLTHPEKEFFSEKERKEDLERRDHENIQSTIHSCDEKRKVFIGLDTRNQNYTKATREIYDCFNTLKELYKNEHLCSNGNKEKLCSNIKKTLQELGSTISKKDIIAHLDEYREIKGSGEKFNQTKQIEKNFDFGSGEKSYENTTNQSPIEHLQEKEKIRQKEKKIADFLNTIKLSQMKEELLHQCRNKQNTDCLNEEELTKLIDERICDLHLNGIKN